MDKSIQKIYRVAVYLRLSREDGDVADGGKEVSNSISNQKELVMDYLKSRPEMQVYKIYTDDGYSGVNFDRPGFQEMIKDVREGVVDCIIVKDLSRFGRNYIEAGRYIEKIFPMLNIRFIAITDNYDSEISNDEYGSNMVIPFKNLVNDAYARDISIKVRTNLQTKRRKGEYIGAFVVYGYMKSEENKNQLVLDEYAAEVVKDIYTMKICGMSQQAIADKLNADGILCPYEYKKSLGIKINDNFKKSVKAKWSYNAVLRILKNEIYTGKLIQGKTTTPNYKVKKKIVKDTDECICVFDAHEAIITKSEFDIVQALLIRDTRISPEAKQVSLYGGVLFCADCGRAMVRKNVPANGKKYVYYVCSTNKKNCKECSNHRVSEEKLVSALNSSVLTHLNDVLAYADELEEIEKAPYMKADVHKYEMRISKKKEELEKYQHRKVNLYDDYKDGILNKEEYILFKKDYDNQISTIEAEISKFESDVSMIIENNSASQTWIKDFMRYKGISEITRNIVAVMVDRVFVRDADHIEIQYKFKDKFDSLKHYVEAYSNKSVKEAM